MRLDQEISSLIVQFGSEVTILRQTEEGEQERLSAWAMLQCQKSSGEQYQPGPFSIKNTHKILYLGEAGCPLYSLKDEVEWEGRRFRVLSAHPVLSGSHIAYWRGMLQEKPGACTWDQGETALEGKGEEDGEL